MSHADWSLAGRLRSWFILVAVLPTLLAFALGGVFLHRSVHRELVALVHEELEEAAILASRVGAIAEEFGPISAEFAAQHPGVRMAWRLSDARTGAILGEFGHGALLEDAVPTDPASGVQDLGHGRLGAAVLLSPDVAAGLVIDGPQHVARTNRYWVTALLTTLLCVVLAIVVARLLAGRVSHLLRDVADVVRGHDVGATGRAGDRNPPTEIRAVADELRSMLDDVRRRSRETQLFTATLAHELRSPIQNLIGQAEVALLRVRDADTYRALVSSQVEELHLFADAVDNLLSLCAQSDRPPLGEQEVFDLQHELAVRLDRERRRGERDGVGIDLVFEGETALRGDRESILRGLRNVVANAVEWSPAGAVVHVAVRGTQDLVTVTVDDAGPGIPQQLRESVFQPFVQGPQREGRRIGFGLGLAIAKAAVERHGGTVRIGRSPAGGARVQLTFAMSGPTGPGEHRDAEHRASEHRGAENRGAGSAFRRRPPRGVRPT